jgi:hypothetical protein
MESPFPGMDPYLEAHWADVHTSLVTYARDQIQALLPTSLRARMEERVYLELPPDRGRSVYPDLRVFERPGVAVVASSTRSGTATLPEPIYLQLPDEEVTETYVQIIDVASGGRLVTVIEFLSPANKRPGPGQNLYLEKQHELRAGGVNLVEIDLIRTGQRVVAAARTPPQYQTPYIVSVCRASEPRRVGFYPVPLRQPLPSIRIPLRESDEDVRLDLQALIDQCYRNGAYDDIDYGAEPEPPLDPDAATWADALLRERGLR